MNKLDLEFLSPKLADMKLRFAILPEGRIGITRRIMEYLDLKAGDYVKFGNQKKTNELYMVKVSKRDAQALKIINGGGYYYVSMKNIFKLLDIDPKYKGHFNIEQIIREENAFKLKYDSPALKSKGSAQQPDIP